MVPGRLAHVSPDCLARALEIMERAWPEGEEHMAKLAVNAPIRLWARSKDVFYSMRTSNHEVDGRGCQYQQVFFDDRGQCHYDHVYATELFSNRSMQPAHDFVMASEYVEMARIHLGPGAARGAASPPGGDEDRLPGLSEPSAKVRACGGGADQAAPPGQHAEVSLRGGEAIGGRLPGAAAGDGAADGAGALTPRGGSRGALPQRPQPLVVRHARHGQDAPGEADRVPALAARRRGHPDLQDALQRAESRLGGADGGPLGAQGIRAGRCSLDWLVVEEVTQLDVALWADIAELSTNRRVRFLLLGDFRQLPAVQDAFGGAPVLHDLAGGCVHELTENRRSDERIFRFLQYLRVDEAEQVPLCRWPGSSSHARAAGHLPGHLARPSHGHQRPREPAARSRGGGAAGAPGAGSRRDEPAAGSGRGSGSWGPVGGCPRGAS